MALLTTTNSKVQEREVMRVLAIKLKLEKGMEKDLLFLFRKMSSAFATIYIQDQRVLDLRSFSIDLTALLRKWYRRTSDIFSKNIRSTFKKNNEMFLEWKQETPEIEVTPEERARVNTQIAASLIMIIEEQSKRQAAMIIDTSQGIFIDSVRKIRNNLIEEGIDFPTREQIAKGVRKEFDERSIARADLIAMQEVGMMASEAKEIEANVLNQSSVKIGGFAIAGLLKKSFNATLDKRTRIGHVAADARYKFHPIPVNEKFVVSGELLRFPRDPAGSPGNIINCRCEDLMILRQG